MHLRYFHNWLILALLISACSLQGFRVDNADHALLAGDDQTRHCLALYTDLDTYLYSHGLADVQDFRIPGYPFLRLNRFLASFRHELSNMQQTVFWLQQLSQLDRETRLLEINVIPDTDLRKFSTGANNRNNLVYQLKTCSELLISRVSNNVEVLSDIRSKAVVPDNYNSFMRLFGLYPLSSLFVLYGVNQWHESTRSSFGKPEYNSENETSLLLYGSGIETDNSRIDLSSAFKFSANNPLSIPSFDDASLQALFHKYSPVWEIDTLQDADRFGVPVWIDNETITIDTSQPTVFSYISYTRFNEQVLLQLNYTIWFPARPVTGWLDLLGGHLDGITWRVTLDDAGKPVFYDVMHNCGCYHMMFPRADYRLQGSDKYEEPLLVPVTAPTLNRDEHMVVSIDSGTHYISGIRPGTLSTGSLIYTFADYNNLRNLPVFSDGYRNMFNQLGLVPGTERKERWVLWPMGIIEPGAMRQRGQHATAFVGKRHFDDPFLFQDNFSGQLIN
jgi:hypothetical protein